MPVRLDIIVEVFIFGLVVVLSMTVLRTVEAVLDVRRRLGESEVTPGAQIVKKDNPEGSFFRWIQSSSSLKESQDRQKLRRDLAMAGIENPSAPVWYVIARFTAAIGLPGLFLISQAFVAKPATGVGLIFVSLALCGLGFIAPRAVIDNLAGRRRLQLEQEFPDALDLMVVCVEAGLGMEAALVRVTQDARESHPRITEEFGKVSDELRAGRSRADALRSLADRTEVDTVKSFVALLIQTDSLGTSIGQTLKTYSAEMREHRLLKAEEKAMRVPVLMTVPLVACILPVIVTALLLPPIIDVMRTLLPALGGH